jgi:hypothetical protein
MAKESQLRVIRFGIAALSALICAPVLCSAAGILVGLVALLTFRLEDVPVVWKAAFEVAYLLLVFGALVASTFVGWCVWKVTA